MAELSDHELEAIAGFLTQAGVGLQGALGATQIAGGRSNLTFLLTDGASRWVLRTAPRAGRTPSAHDVAREFRVTNGLAGTNVPVARPVALCEDEDLIGGPFAVAEFVEGVTIQSQTDVDELDDLTLGRCVDELVAVLVELHRVDHVAVGLERFGKPDGYAARQIRRWSGQWELVGDPGLTPLAHEVAGLLGSAVPDQRAVGIVHGDYRIDNALLRLDDGVRVAAVVDWELSTIGDPVADVAMMCVYRHPALDLVLGSPSAWTSTRLPNVTGLAAAYESAGGIALADWDFHLSLGYFKLAVIAAGIDHRFRVGATPAAGFDQAAQAVQPLLEASLESHRAWQG